MPVHLLDVNVLIALAWSNHVHHAGATTWFATHHTDGWATCPITQLGFVRVSSNPQLHGSTLTPDQALTALQTLTSGVEHVFWPDDIGLENALAGRQLQGHRQLTDAYLIALAKQHGGRVATLDKAAQVLDPDVTLLT